MIVADKKSSGTIETNFLIVGIPMAYNVVLACPTLNAIKAIVACYLFLNQFELDDKGVEKHYRDQKIAREC